MPTGYTAGIIDGDITTFEQFATQCTRAFGATIHMRDLPLDSAYEPRNPGDYYTKSIQASKEELEKLKTISDEEIIQNFESSLKTNLEYHESQLEKNRANLEKLNSILESAKSWISPTEDHESLRKFMIDQLEGTIKADGDPYYHVDKITQIKKQLGEGINPVVYRKKNIDEIEEDIARKEILMQEEIERCKISNLWMEKFFESIQK